MESYHLYVISFTVGSESGLAMVAAGSDRDAFQILKNGGSRGGPYILKKCRDIGMTACCSFGLLLESYVNAIEAYDAIISAANKLVGPQGLSAYDVARENGFGGTVEEWLLSLKGETGDRGPQGDPALFGSIGAHVDGNVGVPGVDVVYTGPENRKDLFFDFHNLKGETGAQGPEGPAVPVIDNLNTDAKYVALAASQGVELKNRIDATNQRVDGVAFLGDVVESVL